MFSKFFIERPIFATVLSLLLIVAGLVTLNILPIAQYPEITPPTVQVSATYPGANSQTIAQTVGIPIEQQVNGVHIHHAFYSVNLLLCRYSYRATS